MYFTRKNIIRAFKKIIFPYIDRFQVEKESDEESDEKSRLGNEEIGTTDMPDLKSEESEQKEEINKDKDQKY